MDVGTLTLQFGHLENLTGIFRLQAERPNHHGLRDGFRLEAHRKCRKNFLDVCDAAVAVDEDDADVGVAVDEAEEGVDLLVDGGAAQVAEVGGLAAGLHDGVVSGHAEAG